MYKYVHLLSAAGSLWADVRPLPIAKAWIFIHSYTKSNTTIENHMLENYAWMQFFMAQVTIKIPIFCCKTQV